MFYIDNTSGYTLIDDIWAEMSGVSANIDKEYIRTLVNSYVLPAFNRDQPHVMTTLIIGKSRFYPYLDLTGTVGERYLNHIFLIKQDRSMQNQIQTQLGDGNPDNFVSIASVDVVRKLIRLSYKSSSFVNSPVILYDDVSNDYYYSLDQSSNHVLIYTIMNGIDSTSMVSPIDYEALKWYSSWKISEFMISGMDTSSLGLLNQYLDKIMEGVRNSDSTRLFNPSVSSLSFGGEISIGFTSTGTITQAVQSAMPMIQSGYKGIQDNMRKFGVASYKRYKNLLMKKFM